MGDSFSAYREIDLIAQDVLISIITALSGNGRLRLFPAGPAVSRDGDMRC